ncbi:MAG TPA: hypothetical protein VF592_03900 [Sphingomonas sp.]|jgi:hypothetical protein|uniref:hypothetical protein n=1 Tax=Sphingomonas sp. TaxID=28214 RepID=UPI002EDA9046
MTDRNRDDAPKQPLSPNDADRAGAGSGAEPSEDAGAGYGNHAVPDLEGEPGDSSSDAR